MEAFGGEKRQRGLHRDEGERVDEGHDVGAADLGVLEAEDGGDGIAQTRLAGFGAHGGRERLLKARGDPDEVQQAEAERDERRRGEGVETEACEDGENLREIDGNRERAKHRAGDEAEAEGGANDAHRARAFLSRGDVGDGGRRDGEIAAERAADEAREEEQPERAAAHPDQIAERGAGDSPAQDAAAAVAVGERAPEWREDELEDREERTQHAAEKHRGKRVVVAHPARYGVSLREHPGE